MRVGEVAARAGRQRRDAPLLRAPRAPAGAGARARAATARYDEETVRFVRAIKEAQGLGSRSRRSRSTSRVAARRRAPTEALRVRLAAKIDEVDARIAGLLRVREGLAQVIGCACDSLDHCTCGAAYLARRGREPGLARPALLHVTNGDSAGNTLAADALGGAVLSLARRPPRGPGAGRAATRAARMRAPRSSPSAGWGSRRAIRAALERRDRQLVEALRDGRRVVLWFEHDLYDQLQLLQVLALAARAGRPELIVVGSFPGRPGFRGLGELTADELETLWPRAAPATDEDARAGGRGVGRVPRARAARRSPSWRRGEHAGACRSSRRRCVGCSRSCPARATGSRAPSGGAARRSRRAPRRPVAAFLAAQAAEEAPFLGDAWFFRRARRPRRRRRAARRDRGRRAAAAAAAARRRHASSRDCRSRLTRTGERVLAGEADRVELLGLDRWVGGTHLAPGAVWRWDGERSLLVAPPA